MRSTRGGALVPLRLTPRRASRPDRDRHAPNLLGRSSRSLRRVESRSAVSGDELITPKPLRLKSDEERGNAPIPLPTHGSRSVSRARAGLDRGSRDRVRSWLIEARGAEPLHAWDRDASR